MSTTITYVHQNYRYFWSEPIRNWIVYTVDKKGGPNDDAKYYANKSTLRFNHPEFKFVRE